MRLRLTGPAARQLDAVLAYLDRHDPQGARNVQRRIQDITHLLLLQPHAGHAISKSGIRRMVVTPYPYAITYRVRGEDLIIRSIRHTSRKPLA